MITKKELDQMLIEANKIFVDAKNYSDDDKIACFRILIKLKDYNNVFEEDNIKIEDIIKAILELPDKEYEIVHLYYFEKKTFKEISVILELSKQRISQIEQKVISQIKCLIKRNALKEKVLSIEKMEEKLISGELIYVLDVPRIIRNVFLLNSIDTLGELLLLNTFQVQNLIGKGKNFNGVINAIEKVLPGWSLPETKDKPLKGNYFDLQKQEVMKNVSIKLLNLSTRTYNILMRTGVKTIGDLLDCSYDDLKRKRNMGKKCIKEVEETLRIIYPEYVLKGQCLPIDEIHVAYGLDIEEIKKLSILKVIKRTIHTNTLLRNKVFTVGDLMTLTSDEVRSMHNLGPKGYKEIEETLNALLPNGFKFETRVQKSYITSLVFEDECGIGDDIKELSIRELKLSPRAIHGLERRGVNTLGKLLKLTKEDILLTRNIGASTTEEIATVIKQHFPFWKE